MSAAQTSAFPVSAPDRPPHGGARAGSLVPPLRPLATPGRRHHSDPDLAALQDRFDNDAAGLRVRRLRTYQRPARPEPVEGRFIAPSLRPTPYQLTRADRAGMIRALLVAAVLALAFAAVTP